ncbi:MAG TPA: TIGR04282 family arsenosugar biosynthesis glycosyltransferase [Chloroflexota bacterium]|nr:TIGR04282 family arsenosugar biosynthesis glycosyltransferase [Chloroflexota bacterium]
MSAVARGRQGTIYVVAKAPHPGKAKTRLCPPLTPEEAARLATAFLLDTVENVRAAGLVARVICRDAPEQEALQRLLGTATTVHVQEGYGLGAALETAFRQGLADGFEAIGVLGADVPTLPPAVLADAFEVVHRGADVALGPSDDGGYYLLVARTVHPTLFRNMVWSTDSVARITLARCRGAGLGTCLLPLWYDVDDAAGLATLREALLRAPDGVAPHTRAELLVSFPPHAPAPVSPWERGERLPEGGKGEGGELLAGVKHGSGGRR